MSYTEGDRIELNSAHDLWRRGYRYGVVFSGGSKWIVVKLDGLAGMISVSPHLLRGIDPRSERYAA